MKSERGTESDGGFGSSALSAVLGAMMGAVPEKRYIEVVAEPKHTRNLFGPLSEIAGKRIELLERNQTGDCLCIFNGRLGANIVDVDARDVKTANAAHERPATKTL